MRVAVDLDDVVLDFRKGICDSFNTEFGGSAKPEDFTAWDVPIMAPYTGTFRAAGYEDGWAWLRDRDWVWPQWPPVPGAIGGLLRLHTQGYDVEILTSKPAWARHCVSKWLGKWRPYYDRVTIVSPKQRKVDRSDADVLVD